MVINDGRAGERVFENVDEALAERIIARSRENSRGPAEPDAAVVTRDSVRYRRKRIGLALIVKVAIPVLLLIAALILGANCVRPRR
jgi:hypothetical protein